MDKPNIMVGVPTYDHRIDIEQVKGLLHLERQGYELDLVFPVSSHISRNRNYIVHEFLKTSDQWLLFWDSDISLEDGFLDKLLETSYQRDADVVCGCYRFKDDAEDRYVLGVRRGDGTYENLRPPLREPRSIDAGGTGIMLIKRKVIEALEDPWFTIIDGKNLFTMPEDFEFCRKVKEAGFSIWCDPRFKTSHFGIKAFQHNPHG